MTIPAISAYSEKFRGFKTDVRQPFETDTTNGRRDRANVGQAEKSDLRVLKRFEKPGGTHRISWIVTSGRGLTQSQNGGKRCHWKI